VPAIAMDRVPSRFAEISEGRILIVSTVNAI
jgi:hypothetical protein